MQMLKTTRDRCIIEPNWQNENCALGLEACGVESERDLFLDEPSMVNTVATQEHRDGL